MDLKTIFPVDFFLHYPLQVYLRSTLPRPSGKHAGIFLTDERVAILVKSTPKPGLASFYNYSVEGYSGVPTMHTPGSEETVTHKAASPFRREILSRHQVDRDGKFSFVIDSTQGYFNLHSIDPKQFSKNGDFRRLLVNNTIEIIPTWNSTDPHEWELLNQDFQPVHDSHVNEQVFVVGMPHSTIRPLLRWASVQSGVISGIVPAPIAVAAWFAERFHASPDPVFLLYSRGVQTVLFFFLSGKCVHVKRLRENAENLMHSLPEITKEMEDLLDERGITHSDAPLFVWESGETGMDVTEMIGNRIWPHSIPLNRALAMERDKITYGGDLQADAHILDWAVCSTT